MTPERLHLSEFGPYTDEQVIDFQELGEHQLFLVHGPTGSGKSMLLDAICFALYGETSGDERDGHQLRSDFADLDDPTEVVLDFRLGDSRYRVERRPRQELAKKRGEGVTEKREQATLYERTDTDDTSDDGTPLADGKMDVDDRVESLLGLAADQFRQVVVLPQGKFREFLSAGSSEREEILKVLFETDRFEDLQDTLKEMAKEARERVQRLREKAAGKLERQEVESIEELEEKRAAVADALATAKQEREALEEKLDEAREALETAKSARDLLDELDEARETVAELREERDEQEARKERLTSAQRAAEVAPIKDDLAARRAAKKEADDALSEARAELAEAESALEKAEAQLQAEKAKEDEREGLRSEKTRLEGLSEDVETLEAVVADLQEKREARDAAKSALDEAQERKAEREEDLVAAKETLSELEERAGKVDLRQKEFDGAQALKDAFAELETRRDAVEEAKEELAAAEEKRDARQDAFASAAEALDEVEARRREAYAAVLAEDLSDGEPCPVCGAREHPHPARAAHDIPGEAEVEAARQEKQSARKALDEARDAVSSAETTLATRKAKVESLLESHPSLTDLSAEEVEAQFDDARAALDDAQTAAERAGEVRDRVDELAETVDAAEAAIAERTEALTEAQRAEDRLSSRADTIRERLPDDVSSREDFDAALDEVTATLEEMEAALEAAEEAHRDARETRVQKNEAVENAEANVQDAGEKLSAAQERFRAAVQANGFESAEAFEKARMTPEERAELKETVEAFDRKWSAATDRKARLEEKAAEVDSPDVEAARERVDELEAEVDTKKEAVTRKEVQRQEIDDTLDALADVEDELAEADARYEDVGLLSETANGQNGLKMSLQRYVLATRLEDVLQVANERMEEMTQSRYHLHRAEEVRDYRSGAGLDLLVHDSYTGESRPVSTLSGGEGFLAALALALGLSDVVQNVSGGRHLETIFIDEGFGSLDPEALDRAMRALATIRDTGRLVGIISHVSELKQRVTARLEVVPTQEGSSLRLET